MPPLRAYELEAIGGRDVVVVGHRLRVVVLVAAGNTGMSGSSTRQSGLNRGGETHMQ